MKRTPKKWIDYTGWTVEQHEAHLRTEPAFLDYYKQFNPKCIDEFIRKYAAGKYDRLEREKYYKSAYEAYQMRYLSSADSYIDQILQKKLFDLQCQWRAGLIELPLVDIIADFDYWSSSEKIRSCPFIPPISEADIDLCIRFLNEEIDWSQDNYTERIWQDYDGFKNQQFVDDHAGELEAEAIADYSCAEMCDIYQFFNTFQGTTGLLNLPDLRGKIEKEYNAVGRDIYEKAYDAKSKAEGTYKEPDLIEVDEQGIPVPYEYLPNLYAFDPDNFIEAVEDEHTKELNKYYNHCRKRNHDLNYDGLEDDLAFLQETNEPVAIDAYSDWRIAVRVAVYKFRQKKAAEMLPYAYDSYLLEFDDEEDVNKSIANRVAAYKYDEEDRYNTYKRLMHYKKIFLDGREALTGKRDFKYF